MPELARRGEVVRSIDPKRETLRATHRGSNPAFMSGTRAAQTILARVPHDPQTGHMGASDPTESQPTPHLASRGPSTYGQPGLTPGCDRMDGAQVTSAGHAHPASSTSSSQSSVE